MRGKVPHDAGEAHDRVRRDVFQKGGSGGFHACPSHADNRYIGSRTSDCRDHRCGVQIAGSLAGDHKHLTQRGSPRGARSYRQPALALRYEGKKVLDLGV